MKKICCLFVCSAIIMYSCSKEEDNYGNVRRNIVVANGRISDVITDENIYDVTNLTINGIISGEDWNILFEMAAMGKLEILDMAKAKIVGDANVDCWKDDEIPEYEFSHSKTLKEVFLPNSLTVIGEEAFAECSKLEIVHFSEEIDSIAPRAFYKSGLSGEFLIPEKLRVIGKQAFGGTKLAKVIIKSDVLAANDSIVYMIGGNSVFANCQELTEVEVKEGCTMLELGFDRCSSLSTVSLPSTLRQIGHKSRFTHNYIFNQCKSLESIVLPSKLWLVGYNAFANTSLKEIEIPDGVQYLGSYAFSDCVQLKSIKMPQQLKQIKQGCFEGCSSLLEIDIPNKVTEIDYRAFYGCSTLRKVSFGDNITTIGRYAFQNCTMLHTALLPTHLSSLRESAFEGCSNLAIVRMSDDIEEIEPCTFKDCVELHDLTIGSSVTKIGSSAFLHCPKLESINLPLSISSIDFYAFAYTGLRQMNVKWASPVPIASNTFVGVNLSKATLTVPTGGSAVYNESPVWKDFGQIKEQE